MGLRLIIGRAGSGKTGLCYREICERLDNSQNNPLVLLVPEQATYQNELALALKAPRGGLFRLQVLSFRRLAWRVLQEVGGACRVHIGELGKTMLVRGIIERRKKELKLFRRAAEQPGFTDVMTSFLSELKLYNIPPGNLSGKAAWLDCPSANRLADKLRDIDMVYRDLEDRLQGKYIDPDDYMHLLAGKISLSSTLAGAEVWVDGFNGFTPQEYLVLEKLMKTATSVNITVCADRSVIDRTPAEGEAFYATGETVQKLKEIALGKGIPMAGPVFLEESRRFCHAPDLQFLEKNFFDNNCLPYKGECPSIKIVAAAGPRAEVEAAAREIIRLCRDENYRWREIAVLVRDINSYHVLFSTVFRDYGIPFFIDHKGSVTHHPLVELIRSALEVAGSGWAYEPVFRYLKTDLAPVDREDADILENYVLAHGIRGAAWTDREDWRFIRPSPEGEVNAAGNEALLERVNRARRVGLGALMNFYHRIRQESLLTYRAMAEALFNLLVELDVPSRLVEWGEQAEVEQNLAQAGEHDRIWGLVIDLLDQVVAAFGEDTTTPEKFAAVLESGLLRLRLGLIPPAMDQVTVGSLDRSRSPVIKAALVLGVNDGVFPARPSGYGPLTDAERETLDGLGIKLAPGSRKNVFYEQFLVYTALTRASHFLWISYCTVDGENGSMLPSRIVHRIRELMPGVPECPVAVEPSGTGEEDMEFVAERTRTMGYLACRLREYLSGKDNHQLWWDVYNWYMTNEEPGDGFDMVRRGLFHRNRENGLPPELAVQIFGPKLRAGISAIERFCACPFAHLMAHGLKLRERQHYRLTPPDMGQFFHTALKLFAERLRQEALDWGQLNRGTVARLMGEIVDKTVPRLQNEILLSSARYRYLVTRLKRRLTRSAMVLAEHARRGRFRPAAVELGFGPGQALPPVKIPLPGGRTVEIAGRIDRVDVCRWEKGNHIVVIDYKSGFNDIDLTGVYYGVNIQLPAYLDVAVANWELIAGEQALPGGVFYFTVADPVIKTEGPVSDHEAEKRVLKKLKLRGLVLADPDLVRLLDGEIGRYSDIIPVALNARGDFYKNSPVVTGEHFMLLGTYLRELYRRVGRSVYSGQAGIQPIKLKKYNSCNYCRFRPICQFDPLLPENRYRIPPVMENEQVWEKISTVVGGAGDE